jgi:hypothetical protein
MRALWQHLLICGCLVFALGNPGNSFADEPEELPSVMSPDASPTIVAPTSSDENRWRYVNHEGRWWYWLPSNRWVVWDGGRWVEPPTAVGRAYVVPAPPRPLLAPRPRSWYYTGRTYDGPAYYYDEFYRPYGTYSPHVGPAYPTYSYPYGGYHGHYHYYDHGYYRPNVFIGGKVGGGSSRVRFGVGF